MMDHSSFSLYSKKLKNGPVWYARFYNHETNQYDIYRTTKIPNTGTRISRDKAYKVALRMVDTVQSKQSDPLFLTYILDFWTPNSAYLKTKELSEEKALSLQYINQNHAGIRLHVATYKRFERLHLSQLTTAILEDWKLFILEKGIGKRRFNAVLQSIRIPIRYAYTRQEIKFDPFINIKPIRYTPKEKGILSQKEITALINAADDDPRVTAAVLLATFCGMRRGEVRGLKWKDIDFDKKLINIIHNYIDEDGEKGCKWNSGRTIILPDVIIPAINRLRNISPNIDSDDYVLCCAENTKDPISKATIRSGFTRFLTKAGISKIDQKKRNLTFHGLRHTFVTFARVSGLPDIMVQALAGHKSSEMMDQYSHGRQMMDLDKVRKIYEGIKTEPEAI